MNENGRISVDWRGSESAGTQSDPLTANHSTPTNEVEAMTATQERRAGPRDRPLVIVREGDGDPRHGRLSTYNNHSCRCPDCTRAMREYGRELRERRRIARQADV